MASDTMTKPGAEVALEEPGGSRLAVTAGMASDAAGAAASVAVDAAARLPELADRGRAAFEDANRRIQAASDEMLTVGTAVSFGFAVGLLIGGGSRILVAGALIPVAMMGLTLLDRAAPGRLRIGASGTKPADR